jgi:hypothetical protein
MKKNIRREPKNSKSTETKSLLFGEISKGFPSKIFLKVKSMKRIKCKEVSKYGHFNKSLRYGRTVTITSA